MNSIKCSICLSTRNKASYLDCSLASIYRQDPPFEFETVVVDDGSTDNTKGVCLKFPVKYYYIENNRYRNPSKARNIAFKKALGSIVIAQSDDIVHVENHTIDYLVTNLQPGEFLLGRTHDYVYQDGKPHLFRREYCGPFWQKPFFFLGAILCKDVYRAGGYDEEFVDPCYDDNWFADCLINGLGLKCRYTKQVLAHHQHHEYERGGTSRSYLSKVLYDKKQAYAKKTGKWENSQCPWDMENVE